MYCDMYLLFSNLHAVVERRVSFLPEHLAQQQSTEDRQRLLWYQFLAQ
jgi:hypothetical protein